MPLLLQGCLKRWRSPPSPAIWCSGTDSGQFSTSSEVCREPVSDESRVQLCTGADHSSRFKKEKVRLQAQLTIFKEPSRPQTSPFCTFSSCQQQSLPVTGDQLPSPALLYPPLFPLLGQRRQEVFRIKCRASAPSSLEHFCYLLHFPVAS